LFVQNNCDQVILKKNENGVEEALSPKAEEQLLLEQKHKLEEELTVRLNAEYKSTVCERICSSVFQCQMHNNFLQYNDRDGEVKNPYHSSIPTVSG
jgi:hypothetical protein